MNEDRCFFWIASGGRFLDEAIQSAMTVRQEMADIPRFLFSVSTPPQPYIFTECHLLDIQRSGGWYLDSTRYMLSALRLLEKDGYRRVIYMDTDTYIIDPVYELFDLPLLFNFSGTRAPGRKTTAHLNSYFPSSLFPEYNMGVNPMYVPSAISLWKEALVEYDKSATQYGDNDQGPLRDALLWQLANDEGFRMFTMPQEYNCRFIMPMFLNGRVKILHGRNPDMAKIARDINEREGMRLWQPYQLL